MTTSRNDLLISFAGGVLCLLQLVDALDVWRAGHTLVAVIIVAAALVGASFALSNLLRPAPAPPPGPGSNAGLQRLLGGEHGGWNHKINASFFCYFVSTIASTVVKPWGPRSVGGIISVLGLVGTVLYALRAGRGQRRA